MLDFSSLEARGAIQDVSWDDQPKPATFYEMLSETARKFPDRPAVSFQLTSSLKDKGETVTWSELLSRTNQAANLFRSLGIAEGDTVAYVLPNASETVWALCGGLVAGVVSPINPLLDPSQIAALLRETGAKVVVTLKAFPKTDVPQKVAKALEDAPDVHTVLEVDLLRYLSPPRSWVAGMIRPKNPVAHKAKVLDFNKELSRQPTTLTFEPSSEDRVAALFHTGGTTGMPKLAQHTQSGIVYNGWLGAALLFSEEDVIMCPLPMFHVFAVHVIFMACARSGTHVVFPTPQGYRGEGVFDNFWKLCERYGVTFLITVPTAISALMQRPVDADLSKIKMAFSGSSPLPVELFKRFEKAAGIELLEGYGLTECTCLVSINPVGGEKKIGSVGIPFPYTEVLILKDDGTEPPSGEVAEICVSNPGVLETGTYTDPSKNENLYHTVGNRKFLRTGDLGRVDEDGYLFITGRAKDLIIRGGHNIDPAEIEEALAGHEAVAMAGAIGQPDAHAGELPCVYVELVEGAQTSEADLLAYAKEHIGERAAHPKHLEIIDELPKTAVGKVFKPDLRRRAITRVYDAALAEAGLNARVAEVVEDKHRGLVARVEKTGEVQEGDVAHTLGAYTRPWEWAEGQVA
ncbi:fatty-acyl-CoA synthase/long-chain acyl-CoA synthetase [Hasllibacter halocynthiae]|uniref:Fatty-acyl-CoA synthase/long-chain acyl-CoA synthetase n=1 Tax=Hasllibacter halocynthiae TaxID=595589 RepID=A0A2T0X9I5_9RHOB|nr:acyl-CoA synthetase [Hasllibacter halocynthiae]PRY95583.1 fatty-acyl-CoA synthase/long-chain acyl-CoA synthetase [Hasllibacter halocynthiae]